MDKLDVYLNDHRAECAPVFTPTTTVLDIQVLPKPPKTIKAPFWWRVKNKLRMLRTGELFLPAWVWLLKRISPRGIAFITAELYGKVTKKDGTVVDYGLLGRHLIVTAGKNYIAGTFNSSGEPENAKYHGYGSGTTSAASGDTGLQTEFTTEYVTNSTRPTGSQANSNATYTTVGTFAPDSGGTLAVTEWGLFTASSSTTLIDRQVFSAVNLVSSSDSLATTYVLTIG